MKIGIVSDTHAYSLNDIPKVVLDALANVDLIVHAGDITDLPILEGLQELGPPIEAVCGNMCSTELKSLLPEKRILEAGGKRIGLTHGAGGKYDIVLRVRQSFSDVDIIIFGHSHEAYSRVIDGVLLFNPGTASQSFGILTIKGDEVKPKIIRF